MHLVSTPDPNPGRAPRLEMAASVRGTPIIQCTVLGLGVRPTLSSAGMIASVLLTDTWYTTVVKGFLAGSSGGVARVSSHGFHSVSQGAPPAIMTELCKALRL